MKSSVANPCPQSLMTRRAFIKSSGTLAASAALAVRSSGVCAMLVGNNHKVPHDVIVRMSLGEGLEALQSGRLTAADYCTAAFDQATKFADYKIFTQLSPVYASNAASGIDAKRKQGKPVGTLQGVPYALKDSIDMVEFYTTAGHPELRYFEPAVDADLVKTIKAADAICIGKTQLAPLSLWWTTENSMTGDTGNPFALAYKTGGSSGGSGAAVAARIVPFSIAEDSAGSLRVPAAMNGVVGFRPTTGRWPSAGTVPFGFSDTLGPIARSVADIKLLDQLLATDRPEPATSTINLSELRIGYQKAGLFDGLHPWVDTHMRTLMDKLADAGVTLVELQGMPAAESFKIATGILLSDFPGSLTRYFNRHRIWDKSAFGLVHRLQSDAIKKIVLPGMENAAAGEDYFNLVGMLFEMRKACDRIMRDNKIDVLIYPTTKVPNTPNDGGVTDVSFGPDGIAISERELGSNMLFAPCRKAPSIALFSGMDKAGLPLSLTCDGYSGEDHRLLAIAEAIEKILPPLEVPKSV